MVVIVNFVHVIVVDDFFVYVDVIVFDTIIVLILCFSSSAFCGYVCGCCSLVVIAVVVVDVIIVVVFVDVIVVVAVVDVIIIVVVVDVIITVVIVVLG